jgi:hypothetical protein
VTDFVDRDGVEIGETRTDAVIGIEIERVCGIEALASWGR